MEAFLLARGTLNSFAFSIKKNVHIVIVLLGYFKYQISIFEALVTII